MEDASSRNYYRAVEHFRRARRSAAMEQLVAGVTGKSAELLSYEEVRRKLRARNAAVLGLQEIPLDAIVGSVGRYTDFTRTFLPRHRSDETRWASVELAVQKGKFPPIDVYKIGDAYFVLDGNHRVSIARQLGSKTIEAYVTEMSTRVPLSPDVEPDDLIIMAEHAEFLEQTEIDLRRPGADLRLTEPGRYPDMLEHIHAHRAWLTEQRQEAVTLPDAAQDWYDTVYLPVIETIRDQQLLEDFPGRTEADLYQWISRHRAVLQEELEWEPSTEAVATDLVKHSSPTRKRLMARLGDRLKDALTPSTLNSGPEPGQLRRQRQATRLKERLFQDILVPLSGEAIGWVGLEQALIVAQREHSRLFGLHVVSSIEQKAAPTTAAIQEEFTRRCQEAGVRGRLVSAVGDVSRVICERARWNDLIILNLAYPPSTQPIPRLKSGLTSLIRSCPRPILAVPSEVTPMRRALLAYDGSPKAQEALFIATYLAGQWLIPLVVLTVLEKDYTSPELLLDAREYLDSHGIEATYIQSTGGVAEQIIQTAGAHDIDLLIVGGYGSTPVEEVVRGSSVDDLLRYRSHAMLICR